MDTRVHNVDRLLLHSCYVTALLVLLSGCSHSESSGRSSGRSAASDLSSSPSAENAVPISMVSASESGQVSPIVKRYIEINGSSEEGTSSTEGDKERPPTRLLRSSEESKSLGEIRKLDPEARVAVLSQLVEAAAQHPEVVRRVEDATHAAVGLDPAMRLRVIEEIVQPGCQTEASSRQYQAAVRIGMFLRVDEEIVPGFAEKALRVMLDTPEADRPDGVYAMIRRLKVYSEGLSAVDPVERCRLWAAVLEHQQFDPGFLRPVDNYLLEEFSQLDANQVGSDYAVLLSWFLGRRHKMNRASSPGRLSLAVDAEMEQEIRCAELFEALLKADPQPAIECLSNDELNGKLGRMKFSFPELFAELPQPGLRLLALKEKEAFLAALEARRLYKANAEANSSGPPPRDPTLSGPPDLPELRLVGDYCTPDERRELAVAIAKEMKTCDKNKLPGWVMRLTAVASALKPEECVAALEFLDPSPFDSEQKEPAVEFNLYRDFVAAMPAEAGDKVTRWLFERLRTSDKPPAQYAHALPECGGDCSAKTATVIIDYVSNNHGLLASGGLWDSLTAIAAKVPKPEADSFVAKLLAEAKDHPDAITSVALARLAGLLTNASSDVRYQAFELVMDKTDYNPEVLGDRWRTALVEYNCRPALAAIVAGLDPDDKQKAFDILMATLTGTSATPEAQVLAGGLAAVASDVSNADAERAFAVLVRLNAADRQSHPKMPRHVLAFLEARDHKEWPDLIKQLLPSMMSGEFRDSSSSTSNPAAILKVAASEIPSSDIQELLKEMYDSLPDLERVASLELVSPLLDRIPPKEREAVAQDLFRKMQGTDNPFHLSVFAQSVARLGNGVSSETRVAVANELLDEFKASVNEARTGNSRDPQRKGGRYYCEPLSVLLPTLDPEDAAPLRDRLVKLLCLIVYQSESLPEPPEVVRVYPDPQRLASEVAQILGQTQAPMSPEVMDTTLFCLASFGRESHPVGLKKVCNSINLCQGTASPGVAVNLITELSKDPLPRSMDGWDQIISAATPKIQAEDLPAFYAACWDAYTRFANPGQRSPNVGFGECLIRLGRLLPEDVAWTAIQDVQKLSQQVTIQYHRSVLQRLYSVLYDQLPEDRKQQVEPVLASPGQPNPHSNASRSRRPSRTPTPEVSIEDLADINTRSQNLRQFLRSQGGLPLEERLALVQQLDERGILTTGPRARYQEEVAEWFINDIPPEAKESMLRMLAEPDCVGFKQSLLAIALAVHHTGRLDGGELWDLTELLGIEQ